MNNDQLLRDTENSLRDLITLILSEEYGENWVEKSGVTPERISVWRAKMKEDKHTHDNRILYYSDFYDLSTCIEKNGSLFNPILKDTKLIKVFLDLLNKFRNAIAHGREILPYQSNLISGMCGYVRTEIIKYRSKKETNEDCFARIEFAQDNLGNFLKVESMSELGHPIYGKQTLRPGDTLEFLVRASDPENAQLEYCLSDPSGYEWVKDNKFVVKITEKNIGVNTAWIILVRSPRKHSAFSYPVQHDDKVMFQYKVLPL